LTFIAVEVKEKERSWL